MDWRPSGEGNGDRSSLGDRLGALAQLLVAGVILLSVVGFDSIGTVLSRLAATIPAATVSIGPGVGIAFLAIAVLALCGVLALGVLAWYRLPDPPS
jgi:phosphoribosylcarboxyaminoimidazole (NCAIR) mutase